jgi:hypothetical protein
MVEVHIGDDTVSFEVKGWHKLWAFKRCIDVPIKHIRSVRHEPKLTFHRDIRMPGTYVPSLIKAGTYYQIGTREKSFWDVSSGKNNIVVELDGDPYHRIVVDVADYQDAINKITAAINSHQH